MRVRVWVASLFVAISGVAAFEPAGADTDEIYADGFDGPKWYIDADGDGYGNPAVFVHSATQPDGYVANALDCYDSDAAIHPGAPDDPDAAFTDSNCDGIDGDIAKAIFVATTGVDGATCGTMANPCQTPAYAIGRLDAQHTQIYLQVGSYPGPLSVGANAEFYGGFDAQWQRGPVTPGGPNVVLQGTSAAMGSLGAQAFAVYAASGVSVLFADIEAVAPDASGTANGNGLDSYAFYVDDGATLQLQRSQIVQGDGAGGDGGLAGVDALQVTILTPLAGGDANQNLGFCDNTSHGAGAASSFNACASGRLVAAGKGGNGGTADTDCTSFDFTATAGSAGADASVVNGSSGKGGAGGSGGNTCGSSHDGSPGTIIDGTGGIGGMGSFLSAGLWVADGGAAGSTGDNGSGGGGGGGSGGCDIGADSWGAGGGGGGAGGCAAKSPGSGGGGGGASFGVFANSATVTATSNTFVLANGGNGGNGGRAGIGQAGGKGGAGGAQAVNGSAPGKGGDGGRGGVAGGGGGGQGGSVFGIYSYASTVTQSGNAFFGGVAGTGGAGGTTSAGTGAGQAGGNGLVADVGSCVTAASCN